MTSSQQTCHLRWSCSLPFRRQVYTISQRDVHPSFESPLTAYVRLLNKVLRIKGAIYFGIMPRRLNLDLIQSSNMAPENKYQFEKLLLCLRKFLATPWDSFLCFHPLRSCDFRTELSFSMYFLLCNIQLSTVATSTHTMYVEVCSLENLKQRLWALRPSGVLEIVSKGLQAPSIHIFPNSVHTFISHWKLEISQGRVFTLRNQQK